MSVQASSSAGEAQGLRGAWSCVREQGLAAPRIGDELRFEARLELPDGARPKFAAWPADPLVPWAPLSEPTLSLRVVDGPQDAWIAAFSAMPLKGGLLDSPPLALELGGGALPLAVAQLDVQGELAEGEDAPRALFQPLERIDAPGDASGLPAVLWAWLALPPLVAAVVWWRLRRAGAPLAGAPDSPLARVAALEERWKKDPSEGRDSLHALSALVRSAYDVRAGAMRAALGGMEWADAVDKEGAVETAAFVRRIEPLRWCCNDVPRELVQARFDEARRLLATAAAAEERP